MANPQKENGYTAIANEIMEALGRTRIPGEVRQMLDVIIRKTYGFNKKADRISTSQFMQLTGLPNFTIHKARKRLLRMNMITITKKGDSQTLTYLFQKDYHKWLLLPKKVTVTKKERLLLPKKEGTVTKKGRLTVAQKAIHNNNTTKVDTTKDIITKDRFVYLDDPLFVDIFESYLKNRKTKASDRAKELILKDLHRYSKEIAVAMLEQSIKNGWIGVFELKKEWGYGTGKNNTGKGSDYAGLETEINV